MKETIIHEHPLNEIIRVCLRLEQLFKQVDHQLNDISIWGTRHLVGLIISILSILDRPDLKAKLAKELNIITANLQRFGNSPEINADKLQQLIFQLDSLAKGLINSSGKIGQRLRDIELLNHLRVQLSSAGGGCGFDIPIFHYWLHQPADARKNTILAWLEDFTQIKAIVVLMLKLVRHNAKIEEKNAICGFHQELLDPQSTLRMIRIEINRHIKAYPEVSIGRHFLSVRFYSPEIENRPKQFTENLSFSISYCHA
jgi:cell division protein ZapD